MSNVRISTGTRKADVVTPHRLVVGILIRIFQRTRYTDDCFQILTEQTKRQYVCNFYIFMLKLIQNPDITLDELMVLLNSEKNVFYGNMIRRLENTICSIGETGVRFLQDVVEAIGKMITNTDSVLKTPVICKKSILGLYLRWLVTAFDKLSFSEVTIFLDSFKKYSSTILKEDDKTGSMSMKQKSTIIEMWQEKGQWSRRQAELFIATQAALLMNNEEKALSPKELSNHLNNLLKANWELSQAHFMNYLNYLRVKEFCGAMDSLVQCFDKNVSYDGRCTADEKTKGYRYAALNIAVLQFQFDNREEAKIALEEAIKKAQEAGDNLCLQHALAWMYCITNENKYKLIEHSIMKSIDLNLTYMMCLGIQAFVQQAGHTSGHPKHIFETICRSDILNQFMFSDLTSSSCMQKAALWEFYGKSEIALLLSQLLLYTSSDLGGFSSLNKTNYGEGYCLALCNVANQMLMQGEYQIVSSIYKFTKLKFANEPICHKWMLCENIFHFTLHLHRQEFTEAKAAAQKIAVIEKDESFLRLAELYIQQQDYKKAHDCVSKVFDGSSDNESDIIRTDYHVRAMILMADTQIASCGTESVLPGIVVLLNNAVKKAICYHLDYLLAMARLRISQVQLLMGMPSQALATLDSCMLSIMSHGGCFDRARTMLLYVNCLIANSRHLPEGEQEQNLRIALKLLVKVKDNFMKVEAFSRVKDVLYLQGHLCNELGMIQDRNTIAMEFRLLDEEQPNKTVSTLLRLV